MAEEQADLPLLQETANSAADVIRIIVADSEPIYRIGVRKIVAVEDDIRIVAQAESAESAVSAAARFQADVMLMGAGLSSPRTRRWS